MITKYLGIATALLLTALIALSVYAKNLTEDIAVHEANVAQYESAIDDHIDAIDQLIVERTQMDELLNQREEEHQQIKTKLSQTKRKLAEAFQNDPETKTWGETKLPVAILDSLRSTQSGDKTRGEKTNTTGPTYYADNRTCHDRRYERRPLVVGNGLIGGASSS